MTRGKTLALMAMANSLAYSTHGYDFDFSFIPRPSYVKGGTRMSKTRRKMVSPLAHARRKKRRNIQRESRRVNYQNK